MKNILKYKLNILRCYEITIKIFNYVRNIINRLYYLYVDIFLIWYTVKLVNIVKILVLLFFIDNNFTKNIGIFRIKNVQV